MAASSRERFQFPFDKSRIPANGIYILFERGELAHQGRRIVRIGTHTGNNQLPSRLDQHFVRENKDRSIFRKNIGRALLNQRNDPFLEQWNWDLTSSAAKQKYGKLLDREKQQSTEREVTEYIQTYFSFVVIPISDPQDRLQFEAKLISTVSLCQHCSPSPTWLGLNSPKEKIRRSGLWQVNQLHKTPLTESEANTLIDLMFGAN